MKRRLPAVAVAAAFACAGTFAAAPVQAGGVSWSVGIGVPGFGFYAGQPWGWGARGYYGPRPHAAPYYAPAPVVYGPPPVAYPYAYAPRVYRPHVARAPYPYYGPPVAYRPYRSSRSSRSSY